MNKRAYRFLKRITATSQAQMSAFNNMAFLTNNIWFKTYLKGIN